MYIRTRLIKTTSDSIGFPKKIVLISTSYKRINEELKLMNCKE